MEQVGEFNVIAVNETEAQNMKTAVVNYKQGLDEVLDKIQKIDYTEYQKGFKGAQVDAVKAYIDATVDEMKKMSSFISEFEVAVDKVIANYTSMSGAVKMGDVAEASVEGEGDLAGVNEFNQGGAN